MFVSYPSRLFFYRALARDMYKQSQKKTRYAERLELVALRIILPTTRERENWITLYYRIQRDGGEAGTSKIEMADVIGDRRPR